MTVPGGLSAWLGSLPEYVAGWTRASDITVGVMLGSLVAYQPLAVLLAIMAAIRGWLQGSVRIRRLSMWMVVALLACPLPSLAPGARPGLDADPSVVAGLSGGCTPPERRARRSPRSAGSRGAQLHHPDLHVAGLPGIAPPRHSAGADHAADLAADRLVLPAGDQPAAGGSWLVGPRRPVRRGVGTGRLPRRVLVRRADGRSRSPQPGQQRRDVAPRRAVAHGRPAAEHGAGTIGLEQPGSERATRDDRGHRFCRRCAGCCAIALWRCAPPRARLPTRPWSSHPTSRIQPWWRPIAASPSYGAAHPCGS